MPRLQRPAAPRRAVANVLVAPVANVLVAPVANVLDVPVANVLDVPVANVLDGPLGTFFGTQRATDTFVMARETLSEPFCASVRHLQ